MLITRAVLLDGADPGGAEPGGGGTVDIRVGDTITAVAARLKPVAGEDVLDAAGALVLPGLHDHHVHLRAAVAAHDSVRVGPPQVAGPAEFRHALRTAAPGADGWIRAVGYHDSVAGPLDAAALDAVVENLPVRVQHRSGALWIVNSAGLAVLGRTGHPDGRFHRDTEALQLPGRAPSAAALSTRLLSHGVTGLTDATPGQRPADLENLAAAAQSGEIAQRLHAMAPAGTAAVAGITLGPAKLILDDTDLDLDRVSDWIADSHRLDHPVAVHCVTDAQLVVTMAALREAGRHPGDRIEHAALVPDDCVAQLAELGVTVVTQPNFVAERGDEYLAEVPAADRHRLWRVASLRSAGIPLALSTDLPFGDADPWRVVAAAAHRRTPSGRLLGADERVSAAVALRMLLGRPEAPARPRRIAPGQPGDLCVLAGNPVEALAEPDSGRVAATIIGGRVAWRR